MFAVVQNKFETPVCGQRSFGRGGQVWKIRYPVAVENVLQVAICSASHICAIAFVNLGEVDGSGVLLLVLVGNYVPFVVIALADQPTEYMAGVCGIGNPAFGRFTVPCGDIVLAYGTPECVLRIDQIDPAFDTREQALHSRSITINRVLIAVYLSLIHISEPTRRTPISY